MKSIEITQSEEQRKMKMRRKKKKVSRAPGTCGGKIFLKNNLCIIGVPKGEEK